MPTTYDFVVTSFIRGLRNLAAQLSHAAAEADKNGIQHAEYLQARLCANMNDLVYQVQSASDSAKFPSVRLGAVSNEPFKDDEKTFADCQERIEKTIRFLEKVPQDKINAREDGEMVDLRFGAKEMTLPVQEYVTKIALPQFYFHIAMAYAIMRMKGVDIGKNDWIDYQWRGN